MKFERPSVTRKSHVKKVTLGLLEIETKKDTIIDPIHTNHHG